MIQALYINSIYQALLSITTGGSLSPIFVDYAALVLIKRRVQPYVTHHDHPSSVHHVAGHRQGDCDCALAAVGGGCVGAPCCLNNLRASQTASWDGDHACGKEAKLNHSSSTDKHTLKHEGALEKLYSITLHCYYNCTFLITTTKDDCSLC